jgi:osmotically-inducible protein OsmY
MAERYWDRERDWERGRRYRGEGYYGASYDDPYDRERRREDDRRIDERGILDRLRDEVRSWFNDEQSERERRRDVRERGRWGGYDDTDRDWARQWGYVEGRRDRDWGRGGGFTGGYDSRDELDAPMGDWGWSTQERHRRPSWWPGVGDQGLSRDSRQSAGSRFRGPYAGQGPRGYQRSDERVREDICERMCDNAALDASEIEILVLSGEVTLKGNVHDRYDKRLAEDLAEGVSGVREVRNELRIAPGPREADIERQPRSGEPPRYRAA